MSEFTYTVYLAVAAMAGALVSLFVGVIALALVLDSSTVPGARSEASTDSHGEYQRAA